MMTARILKIALAAMLFVCLLDMPYGYFQLVRFISMCAFAFWGFQEYEKENRNIGMVFFALAVLFQPIIKISLGRELWNIVDMLVGIGLLVYAFRDKIHYNRQGLID